MKATALRFDKSVAEAPSNFARDVLDGLAASPKAISSKYFYDDRGSELFQKITQEPEYYLTRKEFSILEKASTELPQIFGGSEVDLVELGMGDGHKTSLLINGFLQKKYSVNYFAIDISAKAMELLESNVPPRPRVRVQGIVADYFEGLTHVKNTAQGKKLVLFLGSTIGNFKQAAALDFLAELRRYLKTGDCLLIGFDLKKDIDVLNKAYNDAAGLTTQFNLNLLTRINTELGGDFDLQKFKHYGYYNPIRGAMESYVVSLEAQVVQIKELGRAFYFEKMEPIHLEYSYKFLPSDIDYLANNSGFEVVTQFTDADQYFVNSLWKALP